MRLLAASEIHLVLTKPVSTRATIEWRKHPAFPPPVATYGRTRRPLYDRQSVLRWVVEYRPEYVEGLV